MSTAVPVILVTGASRGIGRAIALHLAAQPAQLVLVARDGQALSSLAAEVESLGAPAPLCTVLDLTDAKAIAALFKQVFSRFGRLDGLVNNAGVLHEGLLGMIRAEDIDQVLAALPRDEVLLERRREHVVAGGYRLTTHPSEQVTLVGVGVMMPEVLAAAEQLARIGIIAGVVCLTSPDLVFRAFQNRDRVDATPRSAIIDTLFPAHNRAPIVTVMDGHPHTLAFLAGARGDRIRNLGVTEFGQSSSVEDAYLIHGIDTASIVRAAVDLV